MESGLRPLSIKRELWRRRSKIVPPNPLALHITAIGAYESGSGAGSSHGTGPFNTGSFVPPSNSLLVVGFCANRFDNEDSVVGLLSLSGGGWTYTQHVLSESLIGGNDFVAWYTAPVTTGASMNLTMDCGAAEIFRYCAHIFAFNNYDTGDPVGGVGTYTTDSGGLNQSFTLDATPAIDSYVLAAVFADGGESENTVVAGTGWKQYFQTTTDVETFSQARTGSTSTTVLFNTLQSAVGNAAAGIEIKAV